MSIMLYYVTIKWKLLLALASLRHTYIVIAHKDFCFARTPRLKDIYHRAKFEQKLYFDTNKPTKRIFSYKGWLLNGQLDRFNSRVLSRLHT